MQFRTRHYFRLMGHEPQSGDLPSRRLDNEHSHCSAGFTTTTGEPHDARTALVATTVRLFRVGAVATTAPPGEERRGPERRRPPRP